MSDTSTLSSKFQLSIPKSVRTANKWKAGQQFAFVPKDGRMILVPVPDVSELMGIAKGANPNNYRDRSDTE